MQDLLRKVKRIEIKIRRLVSTHFSGEYRSAFKGSGLEFDEVRAYQYGDDVRFIDWNVSAKLNSLYIKVFREERELNLYVLLDVSGSEFFGNAKGRKSEIAIELTTLLGFCTLANNDKFGVTAFSDQTELHFKPGKGRNHVLSIVGALMKLQPKSTKTNIKTAIEHFRRTTKRRSVLFIISDFLDQQYDKTLASLKKQHDITLIRLYHPAESLYAFSGVLPIKSLETNTITWVLGNGNNNPFQTAFDKVGENVQNICKRLNIGFINIDVTQDYMPALEQFFSQRKKH